MTNSSTKNKVLWAIVTVLVLIYALFPVLSILATSFKSPSDLTSGKFLPSSGAATTSNYEQILVGDAQGLFLFVPLSSRLSRGPGSVDDAVVVLAGMAEVTGVGPL